MNITTAKNITLAGYLQSLNILPCKRQGNNLWYHSPFRKENEPSFKINLSRNEWYDFGLGKGGDIIRFVMELDNTNDVSQALQIISGSKPIQSDSFSFRPQEDLPGFEDIRILPLVNQALLSYLQERKIQLPIAQRLCKEVHFRVKDKNYFAIGFENDNKGFELRNKYFQGTLSPKTITTLKNDSDTCCIFEGFIDYLSYLSLKQNNTASTTDNRSQDYIILNSVANVSKAVETIRSYKEKYCYLDNDPAGKSTLAKIQQYGGGQVFNRSMNYTGYKDLNDYLCGKKLQQNRSMRI